MRVIRKINNNAASVIALVVAAAVTYFFGFTKEQLEEDRKAAGLDA